MFTFSFQVVPLFYFRLIYNIIYRTHSNCNAAFLGLLVDEDATIVVALLVGEHVHVEQSLLCAQAVARAGWTSGEQVVYHQHNIHRDSHQYHYCTTAMFRPVISTPKTA